MTTDRNDEERSMTTEKTKKPKTPKAHPWRAFNPGWLSDKGCGDRVVPLRARPIR